MCPYVDTFTYYIFTYLHAYLVHTYRHTYLTCKYEMTSKFFVPCVWWKVAPLAHHLCHGYATGRSDAAEQAMLMRASVADAECVISWIEAELATHTSLLGVALSTQPPRAEK